MFGYVLPPLALLPEEERERFRLVYCGLCHTLAKRYGPASRWILNYDFTFLALLLLDGGGDTGKRRCAVHPVKRRACLERSPALELAADESVILAWWRLRDGVEDHGRLRGLPYRTGSALLRGAYRKAAALRPGFDSAVRRQIALLGELERENVPSLDRPADTFAELLKSAAAENGMAAEGGTAENGAAGYGMAEDRGGAAVRRRVLEQILYHLGRWIYLIDAADDLKRDAASGNYNPVALRFGLRDGAWTAEARREFAVTLDHSIHQMAAAFELWDFGVWRPILEATFYGGLFQTGKAVLDGSFHRRTRISPDNRPESPDRAPDRKRETG